MWGPRRLLTLLGLGAAAAFAALALPTSAAHAAGPGTSPIPGWGDDPWESCNGAVCLVMEPLTRESVEQDWTYEGIRPFITDWKGDQAYNVMFTPDGAEQSILAGTYNITIEDYWNSFFSTSAYQFGDFVANPDASDISLSDLGNFGYLSGSSIYEINIGDFTNLTINGVGPHDLNYWVVSNGDFSYNVVTDPSNFTSVGYIQVGDDAPMQLWNSFVHPWAPEVPDYLIPNDPFALLDFDPADFLGGALASL